MKVRLDETWDGNRIKLVHTLTDNGVPPDRAMKVCNDLADEWKEHPNHIVEKNVRIPRK